MSLAPPEFDYLRGLLRDHTAIVLDAGKEYLAETRLAALASEEGFATPQDFLGVLRHQRFGGLHRKVLDAMTNNETWFFRDGTPFEALAEFMVPEVMRHRQAERAIALWSAACSTGQEPYSMAMCLHQKYAASNWRFSILATDFCAAALKRAQTGSYRQTEVNRGLPAHLLTRYFIPQGSTWQLKPEILCTATFRFLNLAEPWGSIVPLVDIVFLRNAMIYFGMETRRSILFRVRQFLRPHGFLVLGSAETLLNVDCGFQRVQFGSFNCYQVKDG